MINYLTPEAYQRLRDEIRNLLDVERPKVVVAVNAAAAMGDRSENADYQYGKKRLREIDHRIHYLQKRLENVEVINPEEMPIEKVAFSLWVKVSDESGRESVFQIVGQDEIDPKEGKITFTSPMGRALLGKRLGEALTLQRPQGSMEYVVESIARRKEDL